MGLIGNLICLTLIGVVFGDTCEKCHPGTFVKKSCGNTTKTLCELCPRGTYRNDHHLDRHCLKCSVCESGTYVHMVCTAISDTVCFPCKNGSRLNTECMQELSEVTTEDSVNAKALTTKALTTNNNATVEENPQNQVLSENNETWVEWVVAIITIIVVLLVALFLAFIIVFCFYKKRNAKRKKTKKQPKIEESPLPTTSQAGVYKPKDYTFKYIDSSASTPSLIGQSQPHTSIEVFPLHTI